VENEPSGPRLDVTYSIIIVNYNGGSLLVHCLDSVHRFTNNFELILVDNNSSDGSETLACRLFPTVKLIKNTANLGFARANNEALKVARGQFIVFLNPDTIVTPGWLIVLAECANASSRAGIVTPKLLRSDKKTIDSTGHLLNFKTGQTSDRGAGQIDEGQYDRAEAVPSCCFACAIIRRDVFDDIGLLDEKMVLYFEDVDFSLRARVAGWNVLYCPDSVVYHYRGGVTPSLSNRVQKRAVAYRLRIILKCYDTRNVLKYGVGRVIRDLVSAAAGIKNRDLQYFLGYLRSPFWNLANFPLGERRWVQLRRRTSDADIARLSN
jgi:GT2 family glycosyltransferase